MKRRTVLAGLVSLPVAGIAGAQGAPVSPWKLTAESETLVSDAKLRGQIFKALDAAKDAGNDPSISHFSVRAATVVEVESAEQVVLGGNTEYAVPEAIHGETSMLNHVTALFGPQVTREKVRFVAYYHDVKCGRSGSCGDCRDYQLATTDYERLLVACGQASDHIVRVTRFRDQLIFERDFPAADAAKIPLEGGDLVWLVTSAQEAREGGVTLFTGTRHSGAAGISFGGNVYRAAGADDTAFHYRYPIGGLLQQAATERDYFLRVIVVVGGRGQWPVINYRDRQYGFEASSFNQTEGKPPIVLVLTDGRGNFRMTTFEQALPAAFSTAQFMPQAVTDFLKSHAKVD